MRSKRNPFAWRGKGPDSLAKTIDVMEKALVRGETPGSKANHSVLLLICQCLQQARRVQKLSDQLSSGNREKKKKKKHAFSKDTSKSRRD